MEKYVEIREPMISAYDLEQRWPGLLTSEMAEGIDSAISLFTLIPGKISDFPTPYILKKAVQDNAGNAIAYCSFCAQVKPYYIHDSDTYEWGSIFFKLSDVVRYEKVHADVLYAIVSPDEAWPAATAGLNGEPPHAGLTTLPADAVINSLGITPIDLVDILNGVNIYDDYNNYIATKRLVTTDEEGFRAHTYSEPYFTEEALKSVKIYQLDFDRYCEEWGIQEQAQPEAADTSDLEAQLTEAQKKVEDLEGVRRWNKQFLTERDELQNSLVAKDARIAELEKELAAAKAGLENGKGLADVVCRMRREGKSDEEIAAHLSDGGKWCSDSQVGALLHADDNRVASSSMQQRARRLLGKA